MIDSAGVRICIRSIGGGRFRWEFSDLRDEDSDSRDEDSEDGSYAFPTQPDLAKKS